MWPADVPECHEKCKYFSSIQETTGALPLPTESFPSWPHKLRQSINENEGISEGVIKILLSAGCGYGEGAKENFAVNCMLYWRC